MDTTAEKALQRLFNLPGMLGPMLQAQQAQAVQGAQVLQYIAGGARGVKLRNRTMDERKEEWGAWAQEHKNAITIEMIHLQFGGEDVASAAKSDWDVVMTCQSELSGASLPGRGNAP